MKKWQLLTVWTALLLSTSSVMTAEEANALRVGSVDFKTCVEQSKIGKQEQAAFDSMKNQMEKVVAEKENVLNDLANKLNDPDQLDLMSPEAETDLKRKFRALSQELQQLQQQYYQTLSQANMKIIQTLSEQVAKASQKVAEENKLDVILNNETSFYVKESLNVSPKVIVEMDKNFDAEKAGKVK